MIALPQLPTGEITLEPEELERITGAKTARGQVAWLEEKRWQYELTGAQKPVVGRWYATIRLAGIDATALAPGGWAPDFTGIR